MSQSEARHGRQGLLVAVSLFGLLAGCGGAPERGPQAASAEAVPVDPMRIQVSGDLAGRLRTERPAWTPVENLVTVAARLEVDATRITRIGSPVMGRVTAVYVEEGQQVKRGQVLAQLNSAGLNAAQLELLKALSAKMVAERAVERARILLKNDVIGAAELQRREAELAQATAELEAARDELALLGMSEESIAELERTRSLRSIAQIVATMDGTILHRYVTVGQVLEPANHAFEIADLSNLWLVADVPEQQAGSLRVGQAVTAEIAAFAGEKVEGRLSFVSALVNPETRTVVVRMNLPNPARRYKPAMLATMTIRGRPQARLTVPQEAVVREGDLEGVFVRQAGDEFVLRPVRAGEEYQGRRVILEGLRPEEEIVATGAFHLNNERRRRNIRGTE